MDIKVCVITGIFGENTAMEFKNDGTHVYSDVFTLGETFLVEKKNNGFYQEIGGEQRRMHKWNISYEIFGDIKEAAKCANKYTLLREKLDDMEFIIRHTGINEKTHQHALDLIEWAMDMEENGYVKDGRVEETIIKTLVEMVESYEKIKFPIAENGAGGGVVTNLNFGGGKLV